MIKETKKIWQSPEETENLVSRSFSTEAQTTLLLNNLTSMLPEIFFIDDFRNKRFAYTTNKSRFVSKYTNEEIQEKGYGIWSELIHPDDVSKSQSLYDAIIEHLNNVDNAEVINYYAMNFRVRCSLKLEGESIYIMCLFKFKPIIENGIIVAGLCMMSSSNMKESGNLRVYYFEEPTVESFDEKSQKWKKSDIIHITNLERLILLFAKQGMSAKEIAQQLRKSTKTINNTLSKIYEKFNCHSIIDALVYATNHRLLHD